MSEFTQKDRIIALLPMKANSSRVKGKNFRNFLGKPLFRWILDGLLEIDEISQVIINTDARDILAQHNCFDSDLSARFRSGLHLSELGFFTRFSMRNT